jgi:hypothetical protein
MTDEPVTQVPDAVAKFLDRLTQALPDSDTMTQSDVLEALACFIAAIMETMVDDQGQPLPTQLLLVEFMQKLGAGLGGMVVNVHRVEGPPAYDDDDEPVTKH